MQIDEVVPVDGSAHPVWMAYHPHVANTRGRGNTIYVAREKLVLDGIELGLAGAGHFTRYDDRLRLTKEGSNRSLWSLPGWLAPGGSRPPLGYHCDLSRWRPDGDRVDLQSAARGQEFVLDTTWYPEAIPWVAELLQGSRPSAA